MQWLVNHIGILNVLEYIALSRKNKYFYNKHSKIIFIIGAPRTGSTFLYQLLLKNYKYVYISNFASFFYKAYYLFTNICLEVWGDYKGNEFKSQYGYIQGINSPSEAGKLISYWINATNIKRINKSVVALNEKYDKPLLIKNLKIINYIDKIKTIFPNALFIHIIRDKEDTINSIIKAQDFLSDNSMKWFKKHEHFSISQKKKVIMDIDRITNEINRKIKEVNCDQYKEIHYEYLIKNQDVALKEIKEFIENQFQNVFK